MLTLVDVFFYIKLEMHRHLHGGSMFDEVVFPDYYTEGKEIKRGEVGATLSFGWYLFSA